MADIKMNLENLDELFPGDFSEEELARGKTIFLRELSLISHRFYNGKIMTVPKAGIYGLNWFNLWYTPGVSAVSTSIRDNNDLSFDLSNRGNLVAVVSDSTRVLGDGDCTPSGGLGVMEGKAMLMKHLGGVDAVALCINSYNSKGEHDPQKIIDFVKMAEPSFGAVNLEDISQPNCYKVLDTLRDECNIPVWHDDAQGTGSVTLAGLVNALKIAGKELNNVKIVFMGAGAANTTIARLIIKAGADPSRMIMFDKDGALHEEREDIKKAEGFYRQQELCKITNPEKIKDIKEALTGADVLIALSAAGPGTVKPEWIKGMNDKSIVFACANPVPEIYPYAAKEAGAFIVATGRGDFPNQVNNSIGFPGILKGALAVRARKITDNMAIRAAYSIADYAEQRGINPDKIMPTMEDTELFAHEAAEVAVQAVKDGVSRIQKDRDEVYKWALNDILISRKSTELLMNNGIINPPDMSIIDHSLKKAVETVRNK